MVKAAKFFASKSQQAASQVSWHGCVDHLLNSLLKLLSKILLSQMEL